MQYSRDKSKKFDCDVAENCLKEKRNKKVLMKS